jgi:hypothetical protein
MHASGLCEIEECGYLASEVRSHDRRDQIEAIDTLQGGGVGRRIVPVEVDIGAVACGSTDVKTELRQFRGEPRASLAGASKHEDVGRNVRHILSLQGLSKRFNAFDALFIV